MASHMAIPREGDLEAVFHIFVFICKNDNSGMAFDSTYPDIEMNDFKNVSGSISISK